MKTALLRERSALEGRSPPEADRSFGRARVHCSEGRQRWARRWSAASAQRGRGKAFPRGSWLV